MINTLPRHQDLYFNGKVAGFWGINKSAMTLMSGDVVFFNWPDPNWGEQIEITTSDSLWTTALTRHVAGVIDLDDCLPDEQARVLFWGMAEVKVSGSIYMHDLIAPSNKPCIGQARTLSAVNRRGFAISTETTSIFLNEAALIWCYLHPWRS